MSTSSSLSVALAWALLGSSFSAQAAQFCNTQSIDISSPHGEIHPSSLTVSGMTGIVSGIKVRFRGLTHPAPADIDILLVGPTDANLIVMSDVGGGGAFSNTDIELDDNAASPLPASGVITSGTSYRPTNIGALDVFDSPAPTPGTSTSLSVFLGSDPNGSWKLFVEDDLLFYSGSMGSGWCLDITTEPPKNAPPTASSVSIAGLAQLGASLTGSHVYQDKESDPEGVSLRQWKEGHVADGSDMVPIAGATGVTFAPTPDQVNKYLFHCVTPVATTGMSPGVEVCSAAAGPVQPNKPPAILDVSIGGSPQVGSPLSGSHTYVDADEDPEGSSLRRWMAGAAPDGTGRAPIAGATADTFVPTPAQAGNYLFHCVTPVALSGVSPGVEVCSAPVGPVAAAPLNVAPSAGGVGVVGSPRVGAPVAGRYTYADAEGNPEGSSLYRWLIDAPPAASIAAGASRALGLSARAVIPGASGLYYTPVVADEGRVLFFCVTPVALAGTTMGAETCSAASVPVAAAPAGGVAPVPALSSFGVGLLAALMGLAGGGRRRRG